MGTEALGWMTKVWDWHRRLRVGVNGQEKVWMAKDGKRGPEMGVKGFGWLWRLGMGVKGLWWVWRA